MKKSLHVIASLFTESLQKIKRRHLFFFLCVVLILGNAYTGYKAVSAFLFYINFERNIFKLFYDTLESVLTREIIFMYALPHTLISLVVIFFIWLVFTLIINLFSKNKDQRSVARSMIIVIVFIGSIIFIKNFVFTENVARTATLSTDTSKALENLKSLPYISWNTIEDKNKQKHGVVQHIPELSYQGFNLFSSRDRLGAYLMDMHGNIVQEFHDQRIVKWKVGLKWQLIEPYDSKTFLVVDEGHSIFKIAWDSTLLWGKKIRAHHDVAVAPNGDIYVLTAERTYLPKYSLTKFIIDNCLVILSKEGKVKKKISFLNLVSKYPQFLEEARKTDNKIQIGMYGKNSLDLLHMNKIEIIDQEISIGSEMVFKPGDILFCIRNIHLIGVLDLQNESIAWNWGTNDLEFPHDPSLVENGKILLFDNGTFRKYTRVLEVDPITKEIVWEYKGTPPQDFYTSTMGSAQRLPNGNTLITEAGKGYIFEVTPAGKVVWSFYNPHINQKRNKRATIYKAMRLTDEDSRKHFPEKPLIVGNRFFRRTKSGLKPGFYFLRNP